MAKQTENQAVVLTAEVSIAIIIAAIIGMAVLSRLKR